MRLFAGVIAGTIGVAAAVRYYLLGLTLSHYDARGHLIVARRIIDSITPGWQQIGAVWLPLPHLLNMLPVQIDAFYRTGASAVAISIVSFAMATAAIAWIVLLLTESALAALAASAVFALNPNIVYLQATPMTEPLLLGLTTLGIALLIVWSGSATGRPARAGIVLALACLTRYEAWPVTYAALAAALWTRWRSGESVSAAGRSVARVAVYPTVAILAFALFSRVVVGQWFVSSDFFVPDNKAQGMPMVALNEIVWGARELSGRLVIALSIAGCTALLVAGILRRQSAKALIALSLGATAAVPWTAFIDGHPFRIRYMVPLIAMEAVAAGYLIDAVGRALPQFVGRPLPEIVGRAFQARRYGDAESVASRRIVAAIVILIALYELHPFDVRAPMVVEAQWDRVNAAPRHEVTSCLQSRYRGESVMASMGSLGHYMQETSRDGFNVRDFLHEGNGDIWLAALEEPRLFAGWLMIEEKAEGGDMLYKRAREHPEFLRGYSRVCEGAGVALYERQKRMSNVNR
jgi:hypothetical protein